MEAQRALFRWVREPAAAAPASCLLPDGSRTFDRGRMAEVAAQGWASLWQPGGVAGGDMDRLISSREGPWGELGRAAVETQV